MKFYENISKITIFKYSVNHYSGHVNLTMSTPEDSADFIMNVIRVRNNEEMKPYYIRQI